MVDDPKKKKADSKRIALTQKHEVAYMKKIAKEQMAELDAMIKNKKQKENLSWKKLRRICKALLKCLK